MPRPNQGKTRRGIMLTVKDLDDIFVEVWDKIPELRGKSPSAVASFAMRNLFIDVAEEPEQVRRRVRKMPATLNLVRVIPSDGYTEYMNESGDMIQVWRR